MIEIGLVFIFIVLVLIFIAVVHWLAKVVNHLRAIDHDLRRLLLIDTEPYSAKPIPDDYDINLWSSKN